MLYSSIDTEYKIFALRIKYNSEFSYSLGVFFFCILNFYISMHAIFLLFLGLNNLFDLSPGELLLLYEETDLNRFYGFILYMTNLKARLEKK